MNSAIPLQELLRQHRRDADLTLEGLAERSGVSDRTISDIERGISLGPRRGTMLALADALELQDDERERFLASARAGRKPAVADARSVDIEPHRLADFTGRESEILSVVAQLDPTGATGDLAAPVVLHGAPGVGKTSIAIEALHRCASRTPTRLFVDLGGLDAVPLTPLQVLQALLRQLTGDPDVPKTLGEAAAAWRTAAAASAVAILLDDAANEAQIRPVLSSDGKGTIVVTSRRALAGLESARRSRSVPCPGRRPSRSSGGSSPQRRRRPATSTNWPDSATTSRSRSASPAIVWRPSRRGPWRTSSDGCAEKSAA
ncbi:helix-turn-helix domain-containing protein [Microbacterium sp. ProA8]|uniref:helix-turn-helix domain-containing protein n=1 Tax=Microbacterium chionoecetis TaxID=3153754 RepID=UPI0032646340